MRCCRGWETRTGSRAREWPEEGFAEDIETSFFSLFSLFNPIKQPNMAKKTHKTTFAPSDKTLKFRIFTRVNTKISTFYPI